MLKKRRFSQGVHINLEPMSYAFVVIPGADHADCQGKAPPRPPAPSPPPTPGNTNKDKKLTLILAACVVVAVVAVVVALVAVKRRRAAAAQRASTWMESSLDKPLNAPLANSAQW